MAIAFDNSLEASKSWLSGKETTKSQQTQQRVLTGEAMNKIMSDLLGSEQGLASLAAGENASGSFGGTTKTQLSQDFLVKIAGELAALTAPTVTNIETERHRDEKQTAVKGKSGFQTVICTELLDQGKFPSELYNHPIALAHFISLDQRTVEGYHAWAMKVVEWMKKSERLSKILRPIVLARYLQIIYGQRSILGSLTIYLGQPICWVIGSLKKENENGSHSY